MDDEAAAHILASLATPTTATFQHLRNFLLDDQDATSSSQTTSQPQTDDAGPIETTEQKGKRPTRNPSFSVFNGLLQHDDILLYLTTQHVEPRGLFELYCASKPFHYIVNSHMTNYILSSARRWARLTHHRPSNDLPEPSIRIKRHPPSPRIPKSRRLMIEHKSASSRALQACGTEPTPPGIYSSYDMTTLLPFHNYQYLCTIDPTSRTKTKPLPRLLDSSVEASKVPLLKKVREIRHIPSFRYLAFLLHRCRQIHSITSSLLSLGHRLPIKQTPSVLAKMSYVLDLPLNNSRLALFRNEKYFSNTDLYVLMMFFVKLDMCFTDPVDGDGEVELRPLLLQQRSLQVMDDVLARRDGRTVIEILQIWVRTYYRPPPGREEELKGLSVLGVPFEELGMLSVEGWGQPVRPASGAASSDVQTNSSRVGAQEGGTTARSGSSATPPSSAPQSGSTSSGAAPTNGQSQSIQHQTSAQQPTAFTLSAQQAQQQQPRSGTINVAMNASNNISNTSYPPNTSAATQMPHHQASPRPQHSRPPLQNTPAPSANPTSNPHPSQPQHPPPTANPLIPFNPYQRATLLPPDELLIGECIRRQLPLHQKVIDMMLYGYIDLRTGEDLPRTQAEVDGLWEKRRVREGVEEWWRRGMEGVFGGVDEGVGEVGRAVGEGAGKEKMGGQSDDDAEGAEVVAGAIADVVMRIP